MSVTATQVREQRPEDAATLASWINQAGVPVRPLPATGALALVLADAQDQPLACLRLQARIGMQLPRYSYHVGRVVHAAAELGLFRAQETLLLGNDHTGDSELADLACASQLAPASQVQALRTLVHAALDRIAADRAAHGTQLIVELAGQRDANKQSPFWQGLGRFFYAGDPVAAQARLGEAWCSHLAALLPRQTLYLSFLNKTAQASVAQTGAPGLAASQALQQCGFAYAQHVRIDDGGPLLERRL